MGPERYLINISLPVGLIDRTERTETVDSFRSFGSLGTFSTGLVLA